MSTPSAEGSLRFDRIHVYPPRMLDFAGETTLAAFADRELVPLADDEAFVAAINEIEVLFGFGMTGDHWAEATNLRLIQWMGAGVDKLLPAPGLDENVVISNAKGSHEPQMPEWVIGALYSMNHRFPKLFRQQTEHKWRITTSTPLAEKTLCVVGLGTIGQSIAARARNIGMRVTGVRRSGEPVDGVDLVVTPDRRLEVLSGADAVAVVTPLTAETLGLVGAEELAALRPGAMLVDVSRGGITDLDAVVEALGSGQLSAATMDVFEVEPLPEDSPYWEVEGLVVSPHTAGWSPDYADRLFAVLLESILAVEQGDLPATTVDRSRGY